MNSTFFQRSSVVLSIATLTVALSGLSAQAQTTNSKVAQKKENRVSTSASSLTSKPSNFVVAQAQPTDPSTTTPTTPSYPGTTTPTTPTTPSYPGTTTPTTPSTQPSYPGTTTPTTPSTEPAYPDTTTPTTPSTEPAYPGTTTPETTPTAPRSSGVQPGRATRGGSSYIGIGGNIGLGGGKSALGEGNFTVLSKIGLTNAVSVRPSVVIGDNTTILIPLTYDFRLLPTGITGEPISSFAPYVGLGLAIATGDNSGVGPMLTAGADLPIGNQFTVTAGVNAGFFDYTSVGLAIGVGYNFPGF